MLEGIKSKLGFGGADREPQDEYYEDAYGEYEDDYGDGYEEYEEYGRGYEEADGSRRAAHASSLSSRSRSSRDVSSPKLVSIDDVRARTQIPDSLKRDPLPPRRSTTAGSAYTSFRGERTTVDSSLPAVLTPEGAAAVSAAASMSPAQRAMRSEGLNSLFEPSVSSDADSRDGKASGFDPYEAYSGSTSASGYSASRSLTVLKPVSYGEVERIAKTLKAGDAVVLCLRNTPDALAKRILDFSFGVSAALDASVECPGDKVFAISRGKALTEAEKLNLRNQGVL